MTLPEATLAALFTALARGGFPLDPTTRARILQAVYLLEPSDLGALRDLVAAVVLKRSGDRQELDRCVDTWWRGARAQAARVAEELDDAPGGEGRAPTPEDLERRERSGPGGEVARPVAHAWWSRWISAARLRRPPRPRRPGRPEALARARAVRRTARAASDRVRRGAEWLRRRPRRPGALAALVLVALALWLRPRATPVDPVVEPPAPPRAPSPAAAGPAPQVAALTAVVPELEAADTKADPTAALAFAAGLSALLALADLARRARARDLAGARSRAPEAPAAPPRLGARVNAQFLDHREVQAAAFGVGRYVSEEPSSVLDAPATVASTCLADGRPELRFVHHRREKAVWIWVDDALQDSHLAERFARELAAGLRRSAVPARLAFFHGVPDELVGDDGRTLPPARLDDLRDESYVLLLTDGELLGRALDDPAHEHLVSALMGRFASWRNLTCVDFGPARGPLARAAARFGLPVVRPEQVAQALAEPQTRRDRLASPPEGADVRPWAACLALSPTPPSEEEALSLRAELRLPGSPWQAPLLTVGSGPDERAARRALVDWLVRAQPRLTRTAVEWWGRRLEDERLRAPASARPSITMRAALVALFGPAPASAVHALWELYEGELAEAIRAAAAELGPRGTKDRACFPWGPEALADDAVAWRRLVEMGFVPKGDGAPRLRHPSRLWASAAALLTAALLAGTAAAGSWWSAGAAGIDEIGARPGAARVSVVSRPGGQRRGSGVVDWLKDLYARAQPGGAPAAFVASVPAFSVASPGGTDAWRVRWAERSLACEVVGSSPDLLGVRRTETTTATSAVWMGRCGGAEALRAGRRRSGERSFLLVAGDPAQEELRDVARVALRTGSFDRAFVGPEAALGALAEGLGPFEPVDQALLVLEGSGATAVTAAWMPAGLRFAAARLESPGGWDEAWAFEGARPASELGVLAAVAGDLSAIRLEGGGRARTPIDLDAGARDAEATEAGAPDARPRREAATRDAGQAAPDSGPRAADEGARDAEPDRDAEPIVASASDAGADGGEGATARCVPTAHACAAKEWTDPGTGIVFVKVCGDTVRIGSDGDPEAFDFEKPAHWVKLQTFWIQKREFSVGDEARLLGQPAPPPAEARMPRVGVNWEEARALCQKGGHRLPTESEWEYAARGPNRCRYPWGDDDRTSALTPRSRTAVDAFDHVPSPFGTKQQSGNAWEWTLDCWTDDFAARAALDPEHAWTDSPARALDACPAGAVRVVRGGSFGVSAGRLRSAYRYRDWPEVEFEVLGFRCVRGGLLEHGAAP